MAPPSRASSRQLMSFTCTFITFLLQSVGVTAFIPTVAPSISPARSFACSDIAQVHTAVITHSLQGQFKCNSPVPVVPEIRLWSWRGRSGGALSVGDDGIIDTTFVEVDEGRPERQGGGKENTDFERQELRAIFETMDNNNIFYRALAPEQTAEIMELTQNLLKSGSPMDVSKLYLGDAMKGKWKLEFSTEARYNLLPPVVDIYNYIFDGGGSGRLDNLLTFYKSWILKGVRAEAKFNMDSTGKIRFEFEKVYADLLGFKLPLPRGAGESGNYVEIQYFDGDLWIEVFEDANLDGTDQQTSINVYRRVGDITNKDKNVAPERKGERGQPKR
ncbi:unnamed protein product [Choristocarpus tenellus]